MPVRKAHVWNLGFRFLAFRIFAICGSSDLRGTDVLGSSIFRNLQVCGLGRGVYK